jgi:hypothetical protein
MVNCVLQLLSPQKQPPYSSSKKVGRVPKLVWRFWRREKYLAPTRILTLDHPAHTLVAIVTI